MARLRPAAIWPSLIKAISVSSDQPLVGAGLILGRSSGGGRGWTVLTAAHLVVAPDTVKAFLFDAAGQGGDAASHTELRDGGLSRRQRLAEGAARARTTSSVEASLAQWAPTSAANRGLCISEP